MTRVKRPTRAQKIALSKLSEKCGIAKHIGASEADLLKCVEAGHAIVSGGSDTKQFRITGLGRVYIQNIQQKEKANAS